jgi:creatinine amidohydrolase
VKRQSIFLAECTNTEVEQYLTVGKTVIVPVGATEQHGPHDPLGTDSFIATEVGVRIARRIGALVAPPITYGVSSEHRGFQGLSYVATSTMTVLVQDICCSLAEAGFRRIVLLNGHSGNWPSLLPVARELRNRVSVGTLIIPLMYTDGLEQSQVAAYTSPEAGFHANIGETSVMLAIDGTLVDMEHAEAFYPKIPISDWVPAFVAFMNSTPDAFLRLAPAGVWGDPKGSSKELGLKFLKEIEDGCVQLLAQIEKLNEHFPFVET